MTVIELIAAWATDLKSNHSPTAVENARQVIEDGVACIMAGAGDHAATNVRKAISTWGGGRSTVVGQAETSAAPWAALANGTAAHALDYDDTFLPAVNHASAVMVPALFALGEERGASGEEIIDAYIVGLEATFVLARGVMRSHYDIGWHTTSTVGCIGAAAGCARMLKLDSEKMGHAMSIATSMSSGMKVQFGTMAKPLHAGLSAQHAVQAAVLAQSGMKGRLEALEGHMGFLTLCGGPMAVGWDKVLGEIGKQPLAIEARGLMVKRFPCCASTHRILDCLLELRAENRFVAADVESVHAFIGFGNSQNLMYSDPQTELQARFSMQYCVAVGLQNGAVTLGDFTPEAVRRKAVRALIPLTKVTAYDPTDEQKSTDAMRPHRLEITLKGGSVLSRERDLPKGTLKYPFSEQDRSEKFADCCSRFIPKAQYDRLHDLLRRFSTVKDVSELTANMKYVAKADSGSRFAKQPASQATA